MVEVLIGVCTAAFVIQCAATAVSCLVDAVKDRRAREAFKEGYEAGYSQGVHDERGEE